MKYDLPVLEDLHVSRHEEPPKTRSLLCFKSPDREAPVNSMALSLGVARPACPSLLDALSAAIPIAGNSLAGDTNGAAGAFRAVAGRAAAAGVGAVDPVGGVVNELLLACEHVGGSDLWLKFRGVG